MFHSHAISHKVLFSLSFAMSVQRIAPVSVLLAFGPHSFASTVNATVWGAGHLVAQCVSLPCSFHKPLFSLSLAISVQRIAPISVSLAFGPHSCASTVNATIWGAGHLVALCVSLPCSFHKPLFSLSLAISVQRIPPISVSLAFGSDSFANTVNVTVWGAGHLVALCVSLPCSFPKC